MSQSQSRREFSNTDEGVRCASSLRQVNLSLPGSLVHLFPPLPKRCHVIAFEVCIKQAVPENVLWSSPPQDFLLHVPYLFSIGYPSFPLQNKTFKQNFPPLLPLYLPSHSQLHPSLFHDSTDTALVEITNAPLLPNPMADILSTS